MNRNPLPGTSQAAVGRDPERTIYYGRVYRDSEAFAHFEQCPEAAPNPDDIKWVCDQDHWLAWDIPPAMGDRCPVVMHEADSDGRCVGTLSRPECLCREARL